MSDNIFHEVDEEVRREQLKRLWNRFGPYLIAIVLIIVLGVGGWRGYLWWEGRQAAQAGAAFESATLLAEQERREEAEQAFAKIAAEAPAGYRTLARFREAASVAQRDPKTGVAMYDELATDRRVAPALQDLARVRAGLLLLDGESYPRLRERLEPLAQAGRPFRHTAREILAFSAWRTGDSAAAKQWIDLIMTDAETPPGTRTRVEMLAALTGTNASGGV